MPRVASALLSSFCPPGGGRRAAISRSLIAIAILHAIALAIMLATEADLESKATFLATWFLLNFFWLTLLRRPASAALVSLAMVVTLILLSQFKYDKLMMTVNFVDVMILDTDTVAFFLTIYPDLLRRVVLARAGRHSGARLALVARSLPRPAARRLRRRHALLCRRGRYFDRGTDGAV